MNEEHSDDELVREGVAHLSGESGHDSDHRHVQIDSVAESGEGDPSRMREEAAEVERAFVPQTHLVEAHSEANREHRMMETSKEDIHHVTPTILPLDQIVSDEEKCPQNWPHNRIRQ